METLLVGIGVYVSAKWLSDQIKVLGQKPGNGVRYDIISIGGPMLVVSVIDLFAIEGGPS